MNATEAVVTCEAVTRTYEVAVPVEALRSATFEISRGEQVVVCGPSGSGKSTLLNILGLLDAPTGGSYSLMGENTTSLTERDRAGMRAQILGFVFQAFHLLPGLTATENVATGMLYLGTRRSERLRRSREVLARVGLETRVDTEVTRLSGGERQRVAIARAIVHEPELLLADEPTGNLDSANSELLLDLLDQLNADGYTQVIVTHNEDIAARAPRRIDVIDGRLRDTRQ